jgi:DNA-binding NarL/FixJ family response regulator
LLAVQKPLRVAVVAEDPLARAGLGALVGDDSVEVIAQTGLLSEALALRDVAVDVLLVDGEVSSEGADSVESAGVPVVALVRDEAEARAALGHGARGVVRREAGAALVRAAAVAAGAGLVAIDPSLGEPWAPERSSASASARGAEALTPREAEVLQLLAEGLANKEIAARLGISDHTVKFHVNALMVKLGVQSRTEAVVRAARMGWLLL